MSQPKDPVDKVASDQQIFTEWAAEQREADEPASPRQIAKLRMALAVAHVKARKLSLYRSQNGRYYARPSQAALKAQRRMRQMRERNIRPPTV